MFPTSHTFAGEILVVDLRASVVVTDSWQLRFTQVRPQVGLKTERSLTGVWSSSVLNIVPLWTRKVHIKDKRTLPSPLVTY